MPHLFCFGLGYSARVFARQLLERNWMVSGTARSAARLAEIKEMGCAAVPFDGQKPSEHVTAALQSATHLLISIAPDEKGDLVLMHHKQDILSVAPHLKWVGYLSTVGVYGDWDGGWVDEQSETRPVSQRSVQRVKAEQDWLDLWRLNNLPVHIFRLSGIYGPKRNPLQKLKDGTAHRWLKPGQVFNRIHVEDIAQSLHASMERPNAGAFYNITDNEPAPPQDVVAYGAELLGIAPPPLIPIEQANLSPMARSFYGENKRVANKKMREELGVSLKYPTYREGLKGLLGSI